MFLQVVLKIIKHYQEEGQGSEVVQGVLLGLVVDDRLEITNCFPFPQHTEDDADFDEGKHQQFISWNKLVLTAVSIETSTAYFKFLGLMTILLMCLGFCDIQFKYLYKLKAIFVSARY